MHDRIMRLCFMGETYHLGTYRHCLEDAELRDLNPDYEKRRKQVEEEIHKCLPEDMDYYIADLPEHLFDFMHNNREEIDQIDRSIEDEICSPDGDMRISFDTPVTNFR